MKLTCEINYKLGTGQVISLGDDLDQVRDKAKDIYETKDSGAQGYIFVVGINFAKCHALGNKINFLYRLDHWIDQLEQQLKREMA